MSGSEAVRAEWARRVAEAYDGWPRWLTAGTGPGASRPPEGEGGAAEAGGRSAADVPISHTSSGWSWGLTQAEVDGVDRRLRLEERTGESAQAIRAEREYWGLAVEDD